MAAQKQKTPNNSYQKPPGLCGSLTATGAGAKSARRTLRTRSSVASCRDTRSGAIPSGEREIGAYQDASTGFSCGSLCVPWPSRTGRNGRRQHILEALVVKKGVAGLLDQVLGIGEK